MQAHVRTADMSSPVMIARHADAPSSVSGPSGVGASPPMPPLSASAAGGAAGDLSPGSAVVVHALQADLERLKQRHSFEQATADMLRHKAQAMQQQKQAHHLPSTSSALSALSPQQTNELPPSEPAAYELPGSNDDEGTDGFLMSPHDHFSASLSTGGTTPFGADSSVGSLSHQGQGQGSVPQSPATIAQQQAAAGREQARRMHAYHQLQAQNQQQHQQQQQQQQQPQSSFGRYHSHQDDSPFNHQHPYEQEHHHQQHPQHHHHDHQQQQVSDDDEGEEHEHEQHEQQEHEQEEDGSGVALHSARSPSAAQARARNGRSGGGAGADASRSNAQPSQSQQPHHVPRKSGLGSKSKSSCHQCKSSKPDSQLYFCTNSAKEGVRKRRCRKKYCRSCLKRCYPHSFPEHQAALAAGTEVAEEGIAILPRGAAWECPSCACVCICASCTRKGKAKPGARNAMDGAGGAEDGGDDDEGDEQQQQHANDGRYEDDESFAGQQHGLGRPPVASFSTLPSSSSGVTLPLPAVAGSSSSSPSSALLARNLHSLNMSAGQGLNFQQMQQHVQQQLQHSSFQQQQQQSSSSRATAHSSSMHTPSSSSLTGSAASGPGSLSPSLMGRVSGNNGGMLTPGSNLSGSGIGTGSGSLSSTSTSPNPLLLLVGTPGGGVAMMMSDSALAASGSSTALGAVSSPGGASYVSAFSSGTLGAESTLATIPGSGSGLSSHRLSHEDATSYLVRLQRLHQAHNTQASAAAAVASAADAELAQMHVKLEHQQDGGGDGERGSKYSKLSESHRYSPALGRSTVLEPNSGNEHHHHSQPHPPSPQVFSPTHHASGAPLAPQTPDRPLRRIGSAASGLALASTATTTGASSGAGSGAPSPRTMVSVHRGSGSGPAAGSRSGTLSARGESPPLLGMLSPSRSASGGGGGVALAQLVDPESAVASAVVLSSSSPSSHHASPLLRARSATPEHTLTSPSSAASKKRKLPPGALAHTAVSPATMLHQQQQQHHQQQHAAMYDGTSGPSSVGDEYPSGGGGAAGGGSGAGSAHHFFPADDSPLSLVRSARGSLRGSVGHSSSGQEDDDSAGIGGGGASGTAEHPYSQLLESELKIQQMERELRALQAQQRQLLQNTVHLRKQQGHKGLPHQSPPMIPRANGGNGGGGGGGAAVVVKAERHSPQQHSYGASRPPQFEVMRDGLGSPLSSSCASMSPPVPSSSYMSRGFSEDTVSSYSGEAPATHFNQQQPQQQFAHGGGVGGLMSPGSQQQPSESPESLRAPGSVGVRASPDVNLLGLSISVSHEADLAALQAMPPSDGASMLSPPPPMLFDSPQPQSSPSAAVSGAGGASAGGTSMALMTPALPTGLGAPLFPFVPLSPFGGMGYKAEALLGGSSNHQYGLGLGLGLATPAAPSSSSSNNLMTPAAVALSTPAAGAAMSAGASTPQLLSVGGTLSAHTLLSPLPTLLSGTGLSASPPPPVGMELLSSGPGSGCGRRSRRASLCLDNSTQAAPLMMDWGGAAAGATSAAAAMDSAMAGAPRAQQQ